MKTKFFLPIGLVADLEGLINMEFWFKTYAVSEVELLVFIRAVA